jgi:threonine dehydrogenase-like Zn-dependent dehydrogenase
MVPRAPGGPREFIVRALRTDGHSVSLDRSCPAPRAGPGEALVRPTLMAITTPDRRAARPGSGFTGILGHAMVGLVEEVHTDADGPAARRARALKGQRVTASPSIACGRCDLCRAGLGNHCRDRTAPGLRGRDGCFAELVALPLSALHPVPASVEDERAVFAPALAAAAHAAAMFRVEGKPFITVLGDGLLGLLCAQVMARLNARVRLLGHHPQRFTLCERWSIRHRHAREVGHRHDQDVVVDCTGSAAGLDLAMRLIRPRGRLVLMGTPAGPATLELAPLVDHELELVGARGGSIVEALHLLDQRLVSVEPLITRRGRLDDAAALLRAADDRAQIAVVMTP